MGKRRHDEGNQDTPEKELRIKRAVKLYFVPETTLRQSVYETTLHAEFDASLSINLGGGFFIACYRWKVDIVSNLLGME